MASDAVEIIAKAMSDDSFRDLLLNNPDRVLARYELTDREVDGLKSLDKRKFDAAVQEMGAELNRRIILGGADLGDSRLKALDYPVIEDVP
jgi:hypothetical protein